MVEGDKTMVGGWQFVLMFLLTVGVVSAAPLVRRAIVVSQEVVEEPQKGDVVKGDQTMVLLLLSTLLFVSAGLLVVVWKLRSG